MTAEEMVLNGFELLKNAMNDMNDNYDEPSNEYIRALRQMVCDLEYELDNAVRSRRKVIDKYIAEIDDHTFINDEYMEEMRRKFRDHLAVWDRGKASEPVTEEEMTTAYFKGMVRMRHTALRYMSDGR